MASTEKYFESDEIFNSLYPETVAALSRKHWTPLLVAKKASDFLAQKGANILDVGSGSGKFCLAAAYHHPEVKFTGIEQREHLVKISGEVANKLQLQNVEFLHGNFTDLDFNNYTHVYFYNSFYENLSGTEKIDLTVNFSPELFHVYTYNFLRKMEKMPAGTRLVTYHILEEMLPGYHIVGTDINNMLKFWTKA